jgi:hypothetical protein
MTTIKSAECRGRLRERIAMQRQQLVRDMGPIHELLVNVDLIRTLFRNTVSAIVRRPYLCGLMLATVLVIKPRRVWRATRWVLAWEAWKFLKSES